MRLVDRALVEWEGARADLEAGVLRVLHDGSFVDDPTRMLRLVRYAARLDFAPEPGTEALVDPALCATVTGDRLGNELRLALREPQPAALRELERLGLGRALLGERFRATDLPLTGPLALAACCTAIPPEALRVRLDALGFPAAERDVVIAAASGFDRLRGSLAGSDADLWRHLRRERPETVELLAAAGEPGARRWLDDVRHRRLEITGDDLVAAGLAGRGGRRGARPRDCRDARGHRARPRLPARRRAQLSVRRRATASSAPGAVATAASSSAERGESAASRPATAAPTAIPSPPAVVSHVSASTARRAGTTTSSSSKTPTLSTP